MIQAESWIQDLCEDLVRNEIVRALMRKGKTEAVIPQLEEYEL